MQAIEWCYFECPWTTETSKMAYCDLRKYSFACRNINTRRCNSQPDSRFV